MDWSGCLAEKENSFIRGADAPPSWKRAGTEMKALSKEQHSRISYPRQMQMMWLCFSSSHDGCQQHALLCRDLCLSVPPAASTANLFCHLHFIAKVEAPRGLCMHAFATTLMQMVYYIENKAVSLQLILGSGFLTLNLHCNCLCVL